MFHWICPECGQECPPSSRDCPACYPHREHPPASAAVQAAAEGEPEVGPSMAEVGVAVIEQAPPLSAIGGAVELAALPEAHATNGIAMPLLNLAGQVEDSAATSAAPTAEQPSVATGQVTPASEAAAEQLV